MHQPERGLQEELQAELDNAHALSEEYSRLQDELETLQARHNELDAAHAAAEAAHGAAATRVEELEGELGGARSADAEARAAAAAAAAALREELGTARGDLQRAQQVRSQFMVSTVYGCDGVPGGPRLGRG